MRKLLKQMKWDVILTSLLYVMLGIVALVMPETMIRTLGYLIGIFLIVAGAVSMICYLLRDAYRNYLRNDFVNGLMGIAIGIIVLYKVDGIVDLVPVIMGVLVVASGCRKLQDVIDMKRMEYGNWIAMLVLAAVNVVAGVVVILNPSAVAALLFQLIGIGLIVSGVTDCVVAFYFAGKIKKYLDRVQAVDSTYVEVRTSGGNAKQETAGETKKGETGRTEESGINGNDAKEIDIKENETKENDTKENAGGDEGEKQ